MISASKTTFNHYNLKILMPKVRKNLKNLLKKFCESQPRGPNVDPKWFTKLKRFKKILEVFFIDEVRFYSPATTTFIRRLSIVDCWSFFRDYFML